MTPVTLRTYSQNPAITRWTETGSPLQRSYPVVDVTVEESTLSPQARAMLAYDTHIGWRGSLIRIRARRTWGEIFAARGWTPEKLAACRTMYGDWVDRHETTTVGWWPEPYQYRRPTETPAQYIERVVAWLNDEGWDVIIPDDQPPAAASASL